MGIKQTVKGLVNRMPYFRELYRESIRYKANSCFPAGHYYSPIVDVEEIRKREAEIWKADEKDQIPGIELNTEAQISLVRSFSKTYAELPFSPSKQPSAKYYYENGFYSYNDGIILYSMIRHYQPRRIIEVGSGFTSALMLDTNGLFFGNRIMLTFIEPYPDRLNSLISEADKSSVTLYQQNVQEVPAEVFAALEAGDILFIDSSHVAKTGSDVNHLLFQILPLLNSGVLVHFHDITYPFEYPKKYVFDGHNWNENYFLRAFLMYNTSFEIRLFSDYLHRFHREAFSEMPLCYKDTGGNMWIAKKS